MAHLMMYRRQGEGKEGARDKMHPSKTILPVTCSSKHHPIIGHSPYKGPSYGNQICNKGVFRGVFIFKS